MHSATLNASLHRCPSFLLHSIVVTAAGLLMVSSSSRAQNLVPNPSFEDHSGCAGGVDWQSLSDWIDPGADPEYLNECNNTPFPSAGIPANFLGYQYAHSGAAQIAMSTYLRNLGPNHPYATAHLSSPLTAGTQYCVRIWINLLEASEVLTHQLHGLFTDTVPSTWQEADTAWAAQAQVVFNTAQVDTASWSALDATYTAIGGEEFFTFGNFRADSLTPFTPISPPYYRCTFVVDDVWVGSCDVGIGTNGAPPAFTISPNPASDHLTVTTSAPLVGATLQLLNIHGQVLGTQNISGTNNSLNIAQLAPGTYFMRITTEQGAYSCRFTKVAP